MSAHVVPAVSPSAAVEGQAATTTYPQGMRPTHAEDADLPDEYDDEVDYQDMVAPTQGQGQDQGLMRDGAVHGVDGDESDGVEEYDGMYTVPKRMTVAGDKRVVGSVSSYAQETEDADDEMLKVCDECQQSVTVGQGRADENDGNWYCNGCWGAFYETKQ